AAMIGAVPEGSLLVLDEAYVEFAPDETAPDFDVNDQRVIRLRTFSKAYGMAGARVGYGVADKALIENFNKIRNHFGMNRVSQAGALEALGDQGYLKRSVANVAGARETIGRIAAKNGLEAVESATNFVALDCGQDGAFAKKVLAGLVSRGVFVRMPFVAPLDRCIRVSAGTPEMMDLFAAALPEALAEARA
ncbi:MAG: aminotransferase class I/II-fold pyridoxal phosphate-dependent enzyme, partial [Paracoccaceae bacterium]